MQTSLKLVMVFLVNGNKSLLVLDSDTLFPIFISFPNVKGYQLISTTIQSVWETYFQMMQHYGRWEFGRMSSSPIIGQQKTVLLLDWSRMCCEVFQDICKWEAIREMKSITFHFQTSIGKTRYDTYLLHIYSNEECEFRLPHNKTKMKV